MKKLILVLLAVLLPCFAFSYVVVLKNGKVVKGTLIRETDDLLVVKESSNIFLNIKKVNIDLERTAAENKAASQQQTPKQSVKKPAHVVTMEELEKLRDKYDLGTKSFGESTPVDLGKDQGEGQADAPGEQDFEKQVLQAPGPVIVDFWATWCGPCRRMGPIVEAAVAESGGKATLFKVNIDQNKKLAREYGIEAIPTLLFFKNGEIADTMIGVAPKQAITDKLNSLL